MAGSSAGSDVQHNSRQRLLVKALIFAVMILVIVGSAFYVKTAISDGPGIAGATAFVCLLAGLVLLLTMDRSR